MKSAANICDIPQPMCHRKLVTQSACCKTMCRSFASGWNASSAVQSQRIRKAHPLRRTLLSPSRLVPSPTRLTGCVQHRTAQTLRMRTAALHLSLNALTSPVVVSSHGCSLLSCLIEVHQHGNICLSHPACQPMHPDGIIKSTRSYELSSIRACVRCSQKPTFCIRSL